MAGSRTLKLSILADVDDLKKELGKGSKEVEGFGGKLDKFSAAAKAAFAAAAAAAAAYAVKLAVDGVQAAIADEAAQKRLEVALKNVTNATDAQVAAVEEQILKTSLATGVADDKLRPAYQRLAVATGDLEKSQSLLTLALDISAATGKDVETVSNALGKAYEGNTGALTRLGVGLSATEIKTLGLEGAITTLSNTFGGSAATQAETFQGKMARVQVAFDEAKETLGAALLPIIEKFFKFIVETGIPKLQEFKRIAIDPVIKAFKDNEDALKSIYEFGKDTLVPFITFTLGNAIKGLSSVASGIVKAVSIALKALEPIINAAIKGINGVIRAKNLLTPGPDTPTISPINFGSGGASTGSNTVAPGGLPFGGSVPGKPEAGGGGNLIAGGTGTGSGTATAGSAISGAPVFTIPELGNPSQFVRDFIGFTQTGTGAFGGRGDLRPDDGGGVTIVVQAPSVIDEEGFTRAVVSALNNSTNRGTTGAGGLRTQAQIL
jgi:hypothetical protein